MWFKKNFKIKYLLLFVLLLSLIFVFLYFYCQKAINSGNTGDNKSNKELQIIAKSLNTTQWLVYNNDKYHYSIKYPPNWLIEESTGEEQCLPKEDEYGECYCSIGEKGASAPCDKYSAVIIKAPDGISPLDVILIWVTFNKKGLSLEQWLTRKGWSVGNQCEPITINNVSGLSCSVPGYPMKYFIFSYNKSGKDYIYGISWQLHPSFQLPKDLQEQQEAGVYEAVVSTFRILGE